MKYSLILALMILTSACNTHRLERRNHIRELRENQADKCEFIGTYIGDGSHLAGLTAKARKSALNDAKNQAYYDGATHYVIKDVGVSGQYANLVQATIEAFECL